MLRQNLVTEDTIQGKIMIIRNKKVILDKDIAILYEIKPIVLRQQIKRNINRFPEDFMFKLSDVEIETMVSQNVIPSKKYLGGSVPYVFTEQGIAMLSSILNSDRAIFVNIQIIRTFTKLREIIYMNADLKRIVEEMDRKYNRNFVIIFKTIKQLLSTPKIEETKNNKIGFNQ